MSTNKAIQIFEMHIAYALFKLHTGTVGLHGEQIEVALTSH